MENSPIKDLKTASEAELAAEFEKLDQSDAQALEDIRKAEEALRTSKGGVFKYLKEKTSKPFRIGAAAAVLGGAAVSGGTYLTAKKLERDFQKLAHKDLTEKTAGLQRKPGLRKVVHEPKTPIPQRPKVETVPEAKTEARITPSAPTPETPDPSIEVKVNQKIKMMAEMLRARDLLGEPREGEKLNAETIAKIDNLKELIDRSEKEYPNDRAFVRLNTELKETIKKWEELRTETTPPPAPQPEGTAEATLTTPLSPTPPTPETTKSTGALPKFEFSMEPVVKPTPAKTEAELKAEAEAKEIIENMKKEQEEAKKLRTTAEFDEEEKRKERELREEAARLKKEEIEAEMEADKKAKAEAAAAKQNQPKVVLGGNIQITNVPQQRKNPYGYYGGDNTAPGAPKSPYSSYGSK